MQWESSEGKCTDSRSSKAKLIYPAQMSSSGWLTASKGDPSSVFGGFSAPVWCHEQSTGDCEGDDAHDDEEQCGDPLRGQPGGDTGPVSPVDGLTLPDQTDCEGTCREMTY